MSTTVTTQAALDEALADPAVKHIIIDSPRGVWLSIVTDRTDVETSIRGLSTVRGVSGNARVSGVSGDARVSGVSGAARVSYVSGDAQVSDVYGDARVSGVSGAARVSGVWGAARVSYVSGDAQVSDVYGACAIQFVRGRARLTNIGPHVSVHLHSATATVDGGVIIDLTAVDLDDPATWCSHHGVAVAGGVATLYKAVNDQWTTSRGTDYSPGATPEASDWRDDHDCGGGLHASPRPTQSRTYYPGATRYLALGVALADLRPINDSGAPKAKFPRVAVACREVDIHGDEVTS